MVLILRLILFLPAIILTNLLVRIPIFFIYDNILPFFTGKDNLDISYSWLAICFLGFRDFLATIATLYIGIRIIYEYKKIAFYLSSLISILILVLFTIMYPIRFNEIGFWNILGELGLLFGQGYGVYKGIDYIKAKFLFKIYESPTNESIEVQIKDHFKVFQSSNGTISSKTKNIGENNVPYGCYYDPVDRHKKFLQRLGYSIFPTLKESETALIRLFKIENSDIMYEVCLNGAWTKNIRLDKIKELIEMQLNMQGEVSQLQVIINCKKQISTNDVNIWGGVINIYYQMDEWYDEVTDEEFPVWTISIEGISTTLDEPFTREQVSSIKTSIINQVKEDYMKYYGQI